MEKAEGLQKQSIPAVLIVVYRRFHNIPQIVKAAALAGIKQVYLAIDVPKESEQTSEYINNRTIALQECESLSKSFSLNLDVWVRESNLGCAISVITACNWFFSAENFGIVLEDDCLPSNDFFLFVNKHSNLVFENNSIQFLCGTQHAIVRSLTPDLDYVISTYPFLWGWATTRDKWFRIETSFIEERPLKMPANVSIREKLYWKTGVRRARQRRVDVWDTIAVAHMVQRNFVSVSPLVNLINNKGLDEYATNHRKAKTSKSLSFELELNNSFEDIRYVDKEIRKYFFGINLYMPIRNLVRWVLDSIQKSKQPSLSQALKLVLNQNPNQTRE